MIPGPGSLARSALLGLALIAAGCAVANPRPVFHAEITQPAGQRTLVVGVERDPANTMTADDLAREFAFGLTRRGKEAVDLVAFGDLLQAAGRALPEEVRGRVRSGLVDALAAGWLRSEGIRHVVLVEIKQYDQVWTTTGKRTRVGLAARGRDLANGEQMWVAHVTPEVEDEPGRGFQLATGAAIDSLIRVALGEPEPTQVPRLAIPYFPNIRLPF